MGIHGLMSYVGENKHFFCELRLKNTKLIIDGSNLYHHLYFDSGLDIQHGGDYDSFTDRVHKFFETLTVCNIKPYVLLDGGCDVTDKKFETLKQRAKDKINMVCTITHRGNGKILPLLTREVFKQTLTKLHVPFVQCFSEADRELVSLANYWCCPVLTLDSDFCIFDLKAGYCPFTYFQWKNICTCKETSECYVSAQCFFNDKFCSYFSNMSKALLPLFAVLNGNDYINLPSLETFFSKVRFPVGPCSRSNRRHMRIQGLLNWLSCFADPEEAIENVLKYLKKQDQTEVRELLCSSMEEYKQSDVNLKDFFLGDTHRPDIPKYLFGILPEWMLCSLAKGQLPAFFIDALVLRRTFLLVQVENPQLPSCHVVSLPVRKVIYQLLICSSQNFPSACCAEEASQYCYVTEFDRLNKSLKKSKVEFTGQSFISAEGNFSLETMPEVPFYICSIKLWNNEEHGLFNGRFKTQNEDHSCLLLKPEPAADADVMKLYNELVNIKNKKQQNKQLDLGLAHIFCQWQCCLQMGFYLNQLLWTPLPEPDLTRIYSGPLIHNVYQKLKSSSFLQDLLSTTPKVEMLFQNMRTAVISALPADFFSKHKTRSRKHKREQHKPTVTGATSKLETYLDCDVSNRFTGLQVDDQT
ncbi:protein asteroid homolog 1 [Protopterus annectens]|uniref:protein asteroid homolog 1 n=1 Tax=Protopterus annectens TaxID=7888 RepID=UPI001CFA32D9|nr:protein asteroid homolog 1 [Protopterus annectens]